MHNPQIDVARRLLAELSGMAEEASLTGSLRGGERSAARTFNGALATLTSEGLVPDGMFEPLNPEETDYSSLGVQARLLLAALPGENHNGRRADRDGGRSDRGGSLKESLGAVVALAPFLSSEDLASMIRERLDERTEVPDSLLTALAPFLSSVDLGDLVRRRMRPSEPVKPATPEPAPEPEPAPDLRPAVSSITTLESLAIELRRNDLSTEDRQRIATRLAELAYEQSVRE